MIDTPERPTPETFVEIRWQVMTADGTPEYGTWRRTIACERASVHDVLEALTDATNAVRAATGFAQP